MATKDKCRHCGCTMDKPCWREGMLGIETCEWADAERTICTACVPYAGTEWRPFTPQVKGPRPQ
jgi:hypothetical protein